MVVERDFYQVLGVGRGAASEEIRAAYIRLVKRHHPDMVGHLPARLHDVQQAYRCLSDPGARARHDQLIARGEHAHLARQRSVQRRLGRYDHRHRHAPPRARRRRWTGLAAAATGIALVAWASQALWALALGG